jgi:hypothetical protein
LRLKVTSSESFAAQPPKVFTASSQPSLGTLPESGDASAAGLTIIWITIAEPEEVLDV